MAGDMQQGQPQGAPQGAASANPPACTPAGEPLRHQVHHSYIWLGSIRAAFAVVFAVIISVASSIPGIVAKGESPEVGGISVLLLVVVGTLALTIVIIAIIAAYQVVSYRHLYYEMGEEEFNRYSGVFNKKRVHVPYQRIQSVDQRASLLQRIFGVCTVSIDTAGGSSNKAVTVPYVQKSQAEQLRVELFARKRYVMAVQSGMQPAQAAAALSAAIGAAVPGGAAAAGGVAAGGTASAPGMAAPHPHGNILDAPAEIWDDVRGVFGGLQVDTGKVTYEYGLSNKEIVFTGLSNSSTLLVIILGIVAAVAQFAGDLAPLLFDSAEPMVDTVVKAGSHLFGGNLIVLGVVAFLAVAVLVWLLSAIGTCVSFGGFRACRRDNRIEVEYGLLQHRFQGVDVDRVQSVVVKQSFVRRLIGYCELSLGKIDAATADSSSQQKQSLNTQGLVIHPFVKLDRVPEILAGIIPEFADVPREGKPVARVALRRALTRRCIVQGTGFWLAVLVAVSQVIVNVVASPATAEGTTALYYVNAGAIVAYALCVVLLVLDAVGAVLWFRGSSFAYNDHFMQISNGGFARETISFPRKKIQFGYAKTNPFQRHAHTVTVNARTAAGIGGTTTRLIDVCEEDALMWLSWLKPRGNMVQ